MEHDILPLIEGATLTVADGQFGTTSASLIATKRFVFIVPHSARVIPLLGHYLPSTHHVGPTPQALKQALHALLTHPGTTAASIEDWFRTNLKPDHVLELAILKTYKVQTTAMSRGFYYKDAGAFTFDAVVLEQSAAHALHNFLPTPAQAKAANPGAAAAPPQLVETPGARAKGALHVFIGIAVYVGGLVSAVVIPGFAVILAAILAPVFLFGGTFRLLKGHAIDQRTGRAPGSWSSGYTVALILGAFVGVVAIWPTMELGGVLYRSYHGISAPEDSDDVEVPEYKVPAPEATERRRTQKRGRKQRRR